VDKSIVSGFIAVIGASIVSMLGGWDMGLQALVVFVTLDYATGLTNAFINKKLNSDIGFRGIAKKVVIFALVVVAHMLDKLSGQAILRNLVIFFYIGMEGISILENCKGIGIPLPKQLVEALDKMKGDVSK